VKSTYLQALKCESVDHTPVWFMRQAGRYMKDFRKMRETYTFMDLVRTPELAAEVTMQPIRSFGMDAAIIFSDILVLADAFNLDFTYIDKLGPQIGKKLTVSKDILDIPLDAIEEKLAYVFQAIKCTKEQLKEYHTPLIGFAAAPFTLASYVIGEDFKGDDKKMIKWCMSHIDFVHEALEFISEATIRYLKAQVKAGVDALQIFESWNSYLSWKLSEEFSAPYIKKIIKAVKETCNVPITIFGTANSNYYSQLLNSGTNAISFDAKINIAEARKNIPKNIAVQGNLDSFFLFRDRKTLMNEVDRILLSMQDHQGFIFNLGHGVMPETPEDAIKSVIDRVHCFSSLKS